MGILLCLAVVVAAFVRSRAAGGFYDAQTYGMTMRTHRRYALAAIVLAALLVASWFVAAIPPIAVLGVVVLVAVLYGSSFLRGASGDD